MYSKRVKRDKTQEKVVSMKKENNSLGFAEISNRHFKFRSSLDENGKQKALYRIQKATRKNCSSIY